jgi:hypothetical protein
LLDRLGVKVKQAQWSNKVPEHEGEKLRVYQLDPDCWQFVIDLLLLRNPELATGNDFKRSPLLLYINNFIGGDPKGIGNITNLANVSTTTIAATADHRFNEQEDTKSWDIAI